MRILAIVSVAAVAACASSGVVSSRPGTETVRVMGGAGGAGSLQMTSSAAGLSTTVRAPVARVWSIMPAIFDSLGVAVTSLDAKGHVIANEGLKARRTLGKVLLSKYIDCGSTQIGPNAESYDIYATMQTKLEDGGDGTTKITTLFESAARPVQFSGDYRRCTTTGALEARLVELVQGQLR
jgi:hypothetical protein